MKSASRLAAVLALLGLAPGTRSPLESLAPGRAGETVRHAIAHAGGWEAWELKTTVQFRKTTRRLRPDGSIESERVQNHRYRLHPSFAARIEWEEGGKQIVLINDGREAVKLVDGKKASGQDEANGARNATFGSHYVFCMPFKLADPGARLDDAGQVKIGSLFAQGVRVSYEKGSGDAGGLHTWTYYFDVKSGRLVANHLNYAPGKYDFTEYLDERLVDGLRLATRRHGYGADTRGKVGSRVSEIEYEEIRFGVPLADSLFGLPAGSGG